MKKIAFLIHFLLIPAMCFVGCWYSSLGTDVPADWGLGGGGGGTADNSAPTAVTGSASLITVSSATISGSVDPNGTGTAAWFEWGANSDLLDPNIAPIGPAGAGHGGLNFSRNVTGLSSETRYYFRIVAQSIWGTRRGDISSFVTRGADLILNGSFEEPDVPTGSVRYFSFPDPGWSPVPGTAFSIVDHFNGWPASDGEQFAEFTSYWRGGVTQSIPTVPGQSYDIGFAFAPRPQSGGVPEPPCTVELYVDNVLTCSVSEVARPGGPTWSDHQSTFVATDAWTAIAFRGSGGSDLSTVFLDHVHVFKKP